MVHIAEQLNKTHMAHRILHQCARITQYFVHRRLLISAGTGFTGWDGLLYQAEEQGMGPLLLRHITASGFDTPENFIRGLRLLSIRHRQSNAILAKSLRDILVQLKAEGIPSIVLKGAALCQTLYPMPLN